jgi:hypothetical protein
LHLRQVQVYGGGTAPPPTQPPTIEKSKRSGGAPKQLFIANAVGFDTVELHHLLNQLYQMVVE